MYQRYTPKPGTQPPKQGKPTSGEMGCLRPNSSGQNLPKKREKTLQMSGMGRGNQTPQKESKHPGIKPGKNNPILGMLPASVYNPETKKILGLFSAEDLLLAALIFLLLDSENNEDSVLVYLLLYILLSEYIDLPF